MLSLVCEVTMNSLDNSRFKKSINECGKLKIWMKHSTNFSPVCYKGIRLLTVLGILLK